MAGSQIATGVTIINSLLGFQSLSIDNIDLDAYSSATSVVITAGSKVEVAGAFFTFDSDESISGFSGVGTATSAYINLTPAGIAGSQTLAASWSGTAPVWSDSKQGWYSSSGSNIRTIAVGKKWTTTDVGPIKWLSNRKEDQPSLFFRKQKIVEIGDWNMDAHESVSVAHGVPYQHIVGIQVMVRADSGVAIQIPLNYCSSSYTQAQGWWWADTSNVILGRLAAGTFDNTNFNSTSWNRGWIILDLLVEY